MSDIPVWLLDIDGVINAIRHRNLKLPTNVWPADDWIETTVAAEFANDAPWLFTVSRTVVAAINAIHQEGLAEIRWHTTWQNRANEVSDAVGLPHFPVQGAPEFFSWWNAPRGHEPDGWWKLPAVWRVLETGRKVLWTDDDIDLHLGFAEHGRLRHAGCMTVVTDTNSGLSKRHLRSIRETLETWVR